MSEFEFKPYKWRYYNLDTNLPNGNFPSHWTGFLVRFIFLENIILCGGIGAYACIQTC
jgi:hypothetical protein